MPSSSFPDYYDILKIPSTATQDEVKQAYKRESLVSHPDRLVNATPAEKQRATEKFQVRLTFLSNMYRPTHCKHYVH